ncbi:hypothetical protein [Chamaesiphon sp. VAR_48_metabat_403]|uniref:hypothetical protein n=1 Tax=Chamaesiphon sp. VAR_48_metabat_403 TaxID=2964700 RepID=UPI00286E0A92|nr:hypothetical protein [Chamaesiphon sp. VAR_48_metabat_403]
MNRQDLGFDKLVATIELPLLQQIYLFSHRRELFKELSRYLDKSYFLFVTSIFDPINLLKTKLGDSLPLVFSNRRKSKPDRWGSSLSGITFSVVVAYYKRMYADREI